DFGFVRRFVEKVAQAGCGTIIVHARNAVLKGLSPKDNREVPPLRYADAYRLKREFPALEVVLNGGIDTVEKAQAHLEHVDGIMFGRLAYHHPYALAEAQAKLFGGTPVRRRAVVEAMAGYAAQEVARGTPLRAIARHMLGLYHGQPNARVWRRMLSDAGALAANRPELLL